ncbi:MAG: apolipoprotein N-acyltransferase, partial [Ilumatobacter sp.]|nr:apolipoprotein N-acyltransferase [Ilumatobacter sp.]
MPHASSAAGPATGLAFAVAIVGGVFVALSMPPWGFWPLAFVGAACLEYAVRTTDSRRRRAWLGFAFGAPWMFIGMAWMWFLTAPGYVVAALLLAALHGGAAAVGPTGRFGVIGRPAAHTLAEIVRISVPFGGIPLATMGIALSGGPFLQLARVGGVVLLTWFVFQIGSTLGGPLVRGEWPAMHPREPTVLVALVAVALVAVALVAPEGSDRAFDPVTVAAVQGGGEQGTSALDVPSSRVTEAHLAATATIDPDDALDLVVWPENGIDVNDQPFEGSVAYELVAAEAARLGVPLSVGVTVDSEFSADPVDGGFVNAQVLVYPDGHIGDSYEKVRIVPFGEYVPLRAPLEALGAPLEQIPSDAIRGRDGAVVTVEDGEPPLTLGVLISWEVFFGDRGRAAGEADILINPTNGASYTGTIVQSQQVASSKLRA